MPVSHRWVLRVIALLLVTPCLAPAASPAALATTLYIAHEARFTAEIPADWTVDPTGAFDYSGADGFVGNLPVIGQSLPEANPSPRLVPIWRHHHDSMSCQALLMRRGLAESRGG